MQWLEIKSTDTDKTKNKKKKLQKSYKSKMRFQKLDVETKNRQQSWLDFRKGKGAKKKVRCRTSVLAVCYKFCSVACIKSCFQRRCGLNRSMLRI